MIKEKIDIENSKFETNKIYDDGVYENLFVVSSIKPGTGKSFLSANLATAIAKYGALNEKGKKPSVALIEGDLQNLSIGTLLHIEDEKKNLRTAMKKIDLVLSKDGTFIGNMETVEEVSNFIDACLLPYKPAPNLKALVGSQLRFDEIENIQDFHYEYLIDSIIDKFDVVIVDTNSSIAHVSTYSLLKKANKCFYVLNLDYNNVRNNVRYKETLKEMGIYHKVRYVLNEDIVNRKIEDEENLIFTSKHLEEIGFDLDAKIPELPKPVFLNRLYAGTPVVLDKNVKHTEKVKYELLKAANQVYPIENLDKYNIVEVEDKRKKLKIRKGKV